MKQISWNARVFLFCAGLISIAVGVTILLGYPGAMIAVGSYLTSAAVLAPWDGTQK